MQLPGLSLCVQGTLSNSIRLYRYSRFIPVYTGNTFKLKKAQSNRSVYPCVYREHYKSQKLQLSRGGLSLCIQGTLRQPLMRKSN